MKQSNLLTPRALVIPSFLLLLIPQSTLANELDTLQNNLNTVWIVAAAGLVFFMQAGFALLESGASRAKNSVNVMMKNYTDVCIGSIVFWAIGYGLMFGVNRSGFFGESHFLLQATEDVDLGFVLFQTMFAATAATICSGALAERTQFRGYIVASIFIIAFIYPIFGSWVWGGAHGGTPWLAQMGFVDFAGSTVVHSIGAWCALAAIMIVGPRTGRFDPNTGAPRDIPGHNLTLVALGGFILWLGWFGFNGGSTLSGDESVGPILLNTHLAATAGAGAIILRSTFGKSPLLLSDTVNGSLAGLVGITAGCASMEPLFAIVTGFVAGWVYLFAKSLMLKFKLDDVVNAVAVHGFAGAWGTLAAGLFYAGDMFNEQRILVQCLGITVAFLWAFLLSFLVYGLVSLFLGLRADSLHEQRGLDATEHAEMGYPEFHEHASFSQANMNDSMSQPDQSRSAA